MNRHCVRAAALFIAAMLAACDGSSLRPGSPPGGSHTFMTDTEAELAALWVSGELEAPYYLYNVVARDLAEIRSVYSDSTAMAAVTFFPPWEPSKLSVALDDDAAALLRTGSFDAFDALGTQFELTMLDTTGYWWPNYNGVRLDFAGKKNPDYMSRAYNQLDHIVWAEPNGYVGDRGCVYPWTIDDGMSYLVRDAWGDCPAGCIHSVFWYFRVIRGDIEFVGRYEPDMEPEPVWWSEAKTAFYAYRGYER